MLDSDNLERLKEYAMEKTAGAYPNFRTEVRESVRQGIIAYAIWLGTTDTMRGERPDLSLRYQNRARRIYRDFLRGVRERLKEERRTSSDYLHGIGAQDPQIFMGDSSHRGSNNR